MPTCARGVYLVRQKTSSGATDVSQLTAYMTDRESAPVGRMLSWCQQVAFLVSCCYWGESFDPASMKSSALANALGGADVWKLE